MRTQRLRETLTAQGPFVSVYFDNSGDSVDAGDRIDARWEEIRRNLARQGAASQAVDAVWTAMRDGASAVGHRGRGLIATGEGVLIDASLPSPPTAPVVRVSDYPYLLPLASDDVWRPAYLFAAVDHEGADLTLHRGSAVHAETVIGDGYPVHKAATAGLNGYSDFQHSTEEAIRVNVRAVAERIARLADEAEADVVIVCGAVRPRTEVVSALPQRIAARVAQLHAGSHGHRVEESEITDQVEQVFERWRHDAAQDVAERFRQERGRDDGLAVDGVAAVCEALRDGNVDTLMVGGLGDTTVLTGASRTTVAPNADVLSELGEAPCRVVRADEALPFAAVAVGASIVRVEDDLKLTDGVAVLRRYVGALAPGREPS